MRVLCTCPFSPLSLVCHQPPPCLSLFSLRPVKMVFWLSTVSTRQKAEFGEGDRAPATLFYQWSQWPQVLTPVPGRLALRPDCVQLPTSLQRPAAVRCTCNWRCTLYSRTLRGCIASVMDAHHELRCAGGAVYTVRGQRRKDLVSWFADHSPPRLL